jgi:hypothetical protein
MASEKSEAEQARAIRKSRLHSVEEIMQMEVDEPAATIRRRHQRRRRVLHRLKRIKGCAICGCRDVSLLHFDHIRPEEKLFAIGGHASCGRAKLKVELDKCQVLCKKHHDVKTAAERAAWRANTINSPSTSEPDLCPTRHWIGRTAPKTRCTP